MTDYGHDIPGPHICDICGAETKTAHGLKIHYGRSHGRNSAPVKDDVDPFVMPDVFDTGETAPTSPYGEAAPVEPPKPSWKEKLWGSDSPTKAPTVERRPKKRRAPTDGVWTTLWTAAGVGLVRTGADVPVGNCLQFQAPIVGGVLDEAIAGTFIDTLIQPIAGSGKRFKKVSSVVSLPLLVGVMERAPNARPMLEPILKQVIRENLVEMAKVVKAQRKADAEYSKALEDLGIEIGDDPIDDVLAAIFGAPDPEMNGSGKVGADVR